MGSLSRTAKEPKQVIAPGLKNDVDALFLLVGGSSVVFGPSGRTGPFQLQGRERPWGDLRNTIESIETRFFRSARRSSCLEGLLSREEPPGDKKVRRDHEQIMFHELRERDAHLFPGRTFI